MTTNPRLKIAVQKLLKENTYQGQLLPEAESNVTGFAQKIVDYYEGKMQEAARKVRHMRQCQNAYFKSGHSHIRLKESKAAEQKVDQWLAGQQAPSVPVQTNLF